MYKMCTIILGHSNPIKLHPYSPKQIIVLPLVLSSSFGFDMVNSVWLQELLNHSWWNGSSVYENGKPSLVISGYLYRIHRNNSKLVNLVCVKQKCDKWERKLKTNLQCGVVITTDCSRVPELAGMEVKVKLDNCRQTNSEDMSVPLHKICREELSDIYPRSYDKVIEIPKYDNIKTWQCKERQKVRGTEENPEDSPKMIFSDEVLSLGNNNSINNHPDATMVIY